MILGTIYLILGPILVFPFCARLLKGASGWVVLAISVNVGVLLQTWVTYLVCYLFRFSFTLLIVSQLLLVVCGVAFYILFERQNKFSFARLSFRESLFFWMITCYLGAYFLFGLSLSADRGWEFGGNYGDTAFHLSQVSAITLHQVLPPENPQAAGYPLAYHFLINFHSAVLRELGYSLFYSIQLPQVMLALSLGALIVYFFCRFCGTHGAAVLACLLFLLNHKGAINIVSFYLGFKEMIIERVADQPFLDFLKELVIYPYFNFDAPLHNLFQPQRPMLFGFASVLIILLLVNAAETDGKARRRNLISAGVISGLLPLFNMICFMVIAPMVSLVIAWSQETRARLHFYLLPAIVLSLPQVIYIWILLQGFPEDSGFTSLDASQFIPGSESLPLPIARALFWLRVSGVGFIVCLVAVLCYWWYPKDIKECLQRLGKYLVVPGLFFVIINFYRIVPMWGDSNKVFVFLFLFLAVFGGHLLHLLWQRGWKKAIIFGFLLFAVPPHSAWSYIYVQEREILFNPAEIETAEWVVRNTPRDAVFLTSDADITALPALSGRKAFYGSYARDLGVPHSIGRVKAIEMYSSADPQLLRDAEIDYVLLNYRVLSLYKKVSVSLLRNLELVFQAGTGYDMNFVYRVPEKQ